MARDNSGKFIKRRSALPGISKRAAGIGAAALAIGGLIGALLSFRKRGAEDVADIDAERFGGVMPTMRTDSATGALAAGSANFDAGADEHVPTDLLAMTRPGAESRVPEAFRPDMDAPMSPAEREAMRPVTLGSPPRDDR